MSDGHVIEADIAYRVSYRPPRGRGLRHAVVLERIPVTIPEPTEAEAPQVLSVRQGFPDADRPGIPYRRHAGGLSRPATTGVDRVPLRLADLASRAGGPRAAADGLRGWERASAPYPFARASDLAAAERNGMRPDGLRGAEVVESGRARALADAAEASSRCLLRDDALWVPSLAPVWGSFRSADAGSHVEPTHPRDPGDCVGNTFAAFSPEDRTLAEAHALRGTRTGSGIRSAGAIEGRVPPEAVAESLRIHADGVARLAFRSLARIGDGFGLLPPPFLRCWAGFREAYEDMVRESPGALEDALAAIPAMLAGLPRPAPGEAGAVAKARYALAIHADHVADYLLPRLDAERAPDMSGLPVR